MTRKTKWTDYDTIFVIKKGQRTRWLRWAGKIAPLIQEPATFRENQGVNFSPFYCHQKEGHWMVWATCDYPFAPTGNDEFNRQHFALMQECFVPLRIWKAQFQGAAAPNI